MMAPYRGGVMKKEKESKRKERIVCRELSLVRSLSCNDERARSKAVRKLGAWLAARCASSYPFTEHDFLRLWRGLFYCVWMADKPLPQERLAEQIAELFDRLDPSSAVRFYRCALKSLAADWFGIDQHRLDKFLMLARRITRAALRAVRRRRWDDDATRAMDDCLSAEGGLFSPETRAALGLQLHLVDCWAEELAKVADGEAPPRAVRQLLAPFARYLCSGQDSRLCTAIMKNVFVHLIDQTDAGIEYREKARAWFAAGLPGGSVESMQKVQLSDDENYDSEEETPASTALDPRAGHVDAVLPQLPVDADGFIDMFNELLTGCPSSKTNRTRIKDLISSFKTLAGGEYPFKLKDFKHPTDASLKLPKAAKAASQLIDYVKNIEEEREDEQLKGLNKRQRRRMLTKQRKKRLRLDSGEAANAKKLKSPEKDSKKKNVLSNGTSPLKELKSTNGTSKKAKMSTQLTKDVKKVEIREKKVLKKATKQSSAEKSPIKSSTSHFVITPIKSDDKNPAADRRKPPSKLSKVDKKKNDNGKLVKAVENVINRESEITVRPKKDKKAEVKPSAVIKRPSSTPLRSPNLDSSASRRVLIALSKNTSHSVVDYFKSVRQSPDIPYDGSKKPAKTSLKPNTMPSPINPFHKRRVKLGF